MGEWLDMAQTEKCETTEWKFENKVGWRKNTDYDAWRRSLK
jgi:hypothetical protein